MIAIDTNILVYAHRADSDWHQPAAVCVRELAEGSISWGIPWPCIHEFLAIATLPKVYAPPSTMHEALTQVDAWLESPVAILLAETENYWDAAKTQLVSGKIRGPMVHDARIAAICLVHGANELWTADRDLSRFTDLKTYNPLVR